MAVDKNGDNPDEAADRGEFRAADEAKKMGPPSSAPVGHSLLIDWLELLLFCGIALHVKLISFSPRLTTLRATGVPRLTTPRAGVVPRLTTLRATGMARA